MAAALWLASNGPDLAPLLAPLGGGLIADGWLIGAASAQVMTNGGTVQTGGWKPGQTQTATATVQGLGLGAQLATAVGQAAQTVQQLAQGYLTALGRALVDGLLNGQSPADVGKALLGVLADAARAAGAALGKLVTQIGAAAGCWYRGKQVGYVRWLTDPTSNVCPVCIANEAQGAIPAGTPFESGDEDTPAHDRCRCAVVPAEQTATPEQPAAPEPVPGPGPAAEDAEAEPEPEPFDPAGFATAGDARQWLDGHTPDLTPEQAAAVTWYTGPGAYEANGPIRSGADLPDDVAKQVAALDSAMQPLPEDLQLTRMTDLGAFPGTVDLTSLAGQMIADPAFISTSLGAPVKDAGTDVLMHIGAPKGTPAVITGDLSKMPKQREIILARGTRLAVTRVEQGDNGLWEMWLMVIPGEQVTKAAEVADSGGTAGNDRVGPVFTIAGTAPAWAMTWPGEQETESSGSH